MKHVDISILAVLLAEACNIGLSPVAKNSSNSLKYDRLMYVDHQYLRIDTLAAANRRIINAHKKLKKCAHLGRRSNGFGRWHSLRYPPKVFIFS
jgi:Transposase.